MKLWDHPLAIAGIGVALLVFGVYTRVQSLRSTRWPVAPGVITESYVHSSYSASGTRRRSSSARITYRYTVDGKTYNGDLISYAKGLFDSPGVQVSRYPQGSPVDVHYDPKDPAAAVLDPGAGPTPGLALLAGLGCFGYAFWRGRMA